jgi:predicted Fe-Mo cluster-binding NifX family protein
MHNIHPVNLTEGEEQRQMVNSLKISIPVMGEKGLDERVGGHFGKSPAYVIYDSDTKNVITIKNTSEHLGGVGLPPELLAKHGVNIVICSALGPKAIDMLSSYGIGVYVGASGSVSNALDSWQNGKLEQANRENACKEHGH